jgi:hemoglobin
MRFGKRAGTVTCALIAALAVGCSSSSSGSPTTPPVDSGGGGDGATTLYERLGGNSGIAGAVDAIVAAEVQDPDIASFFAPNGQSGHMPTVAQIKACLVLQLGNAAGGPEVYPGTVAGGFTCRSMKAAHASLHIGNGTFDKFISIAAMTLMTAGVSAADIGTIGGVLTSLKPDIVDPSAPDGGPFMGGSDAGPG